MKFGVKLSSVSCCSTLRAFSGGFFRSLETPGGSAVPIGLYFGESKEGENLAWRCESIY